MATQWWPLLQKHAHQLWGYFSNGATHSGWLNVLQVEVGMCCVYWLFEQFKVVTTGLAPAGTCHMCPGIYPTMRPCIYQHLHMCTKPLSAGAIGPANSEFILANVPCMNAENFTLMTGSLHAVTNECTFRQYVSSSKSGNTRIAQLLQRLTQQCRHSLESRSVLREGN